MTVRAVVPLKRKKKLSYRCMKLKILFFLNLALGDPECDLGEELCDVEFHILDKSDNISGTMH
jgi:hypothetical protein